MIPELGKIVIEGAELTEIKAAQELADKLATAFPENTTNEAILSGQNGEGLHTRDEFTDIDEIRQKEIDKAQELAGKLDKLCDIEDPKENESLCINDEYPDASNEGDEHTPVRDSGVAKPDSMENDELPPYCDPENCISDLEERIGNTPKDGPRGNWTGERGESTFIPSDPELKKFLEQFGKDGVEYRSGIPDFTPFADTTVEIDGMSTDRPKNKILCDERCAEVWNSEGRDGRTDWTRDDVTSWRRDNHFEWHEYNDRRTCQLVPHDINSKFDHLGGVSECNRFEGKGTTFDV